MSIEKKRTKKEILDDMYYSIARMNHAIAQGKHDIVACERSYQITLRKEFETVK